MKVGNLITKISNSYIVSLNYLRSHSINFIRNPIMIFNSMSEMITYPQQFPDLLQVIFCWKLNAMHKKINWNEMTQRYILFLRNPSISFNWSTMYVMLSFDFRRRTIIYPSGIFILFSYCISAANISADTGKFSSSNSNCKASINGIRSLHTGI